MSSHRERRDVCPDIQASLQTTRETEKTRGSVSRKSGTLLLHAMVCSEKDWGGGRESPAYRSAKGSRWSLCHNSNTVGRTRGWWLSNTVEASWNLRTCWRTRGKQELWTSPCRLFPLFGPILSRANLRVNNPGKEDSDITGLIAVNNAKA